MKLLNIMRLLNILSFTIPTLVLGLDRCSSHDPECSSCNTNQVCVKPTIKIGGKFYVRDNELPDPPGFTAQCEGYIKNYHCCNQSDCAIGTTCDDGVCKDGDGAVDTTCSADWQCVGKGGRCCNSVYKQSNAC
jgi:hypothetical protein